jgi:hypothetical protein
MAGQLRCRPGGLALIFCAGRRPLRGRSCTMAMPPLLSTDSDHADARKLVAGRLRGGGLEAQLRVVDELLASKTLTLAQRERLERFREALVADIAAVRQALEAERDAALEQLLNARGKELGGLSFF